MMPWVAQEDNEGNPIMVWQEDAPPPGMVYQQVDGGGEGGYDSRLVADTTKYQQKRSAQGGAILEIFNEDTGQWERGVYDIANPDVLLPESVAARLGIRSAPAEGNVASKSGLISELLSDPNFVQFALSSLGGAYSGGAFGGGAATGGAAGAGTAAADLSLAGGLNTGGIGLTGGTLGGTGATGLGLATGAGELGSLAQLASGGLGAGMSTGGLGLTAGGVGSGLAAIGGAASASPVQLAQGYGGVTDVVPIVDGAQNAAQGLQLGTGGTGLSATGGMPSLGLQATPGALEGLSGGLANAGTATAADAAAASMGGSIGAGLTPAAAATVPNWLTGQGFGAGSSAGTGVSVPGLNTTLPSPPSVPTTTTGFTPNQMAATGAADDAAMVANSGSTAQGLINSAAGVGTSAAATTALQRIMSGTGTSADYMDILGKAAPGLISAFGSNQQAGALADIAAKADAYGAPSRARYEASMTPGFDPMSIPGYSGALDTSSQSILRQLSASGGNPFGNPGGLIEANKQIVRGTALPAIQQYQNQNANTGALGSLAASSMGAATNAVGANNNVYSDLGSAFRSVTAPQQMSLSDFLKSINSGNMTA